MRNHPHVLLAVALLGGCSGTSSDTPAPTEPTPASEKPSSEAGDAPAQADLPDPATLPDVVLITLDTTRADRLGSYGYAKARTETLDAVAARGRRYERAYSPLPLTIPSHATLFTGLNPPRHGVRSNSDQVLEDDFVTLAERLRAAGYATGASVSAFVTTRQFGFDQGFDVYFDNIDVTADRWHSERPADKVVDDILGWDALQDTSRPRFAWVHLYDAHFPYVARKKYTDPEDPRPYDAELAFLDDQVQRLLDGFSERPTMVVVAGDHGEGLGEHHELTHGMQVYDSTQRVPLFMAGPGVEVEVVSDPVGLVDVAPILLDTLGLPPLSDVEGVAQREEGTPPIYMESYEMAFRFSVAPPVAVVDGTLKLIALPRPELYDLVADPEEKTDLAEQRPADVERLLEAIAAFDYEPPTQGSGGAGGADLQDQLAALGYVQGGQPFDPDATLADPKDRVELIKKSQKADRAARKKDTEAQVALLRELTAEYPSIVEFHARLASALLGSGDVAGADAAVTAGLKADPDNLRLQVEQGAVLASQRRFSEASAVFQSLADESNPMAPRIRVMAVMSMLQGGQVQEAITLGERYLQTFPGDYNLAGFLGVFYVQRGDFKRAMPYLEQGVLAHVPEKDVAHHLAAAAAGRGDRAQSIELLRVEVRNHPSNLKAVSALARLLLTDGQAQQVVDVMAPALQRNPKVGMLHFLRAQALFNLGRFEEARVAVDAGKALEGTVAAELIMLEANLLKQEGKPEAAQAAFEEAKRLRAAEDQARMDLEAKMKGKATETDDGP